MPGNKPFVDSAQQQTGDDMPPWMMFLMTRYAGSGSTVKENIPHSIKTQVLIQVCQAVACLVSIVVAGYGIAGLVRTAAELLAGQVILWGDALLVGAGIGLAFIVLNIGVGLVRSWLSPGMGILLTTLLTGFVIIGVLLSVMQHADQFSMSRMLQLLAYLGMVWAGALLLFRLSSELFNPTWPPNPFLIFLKDFMDKQYKPHVQVVYRREPVYVTANGEGRIIEYKPRPGDDLPETEDGQQPSFLDELFSTGNETAEHTADPAFGNMLWFVFHCLTYGLSRASAFEKMKSKPTLPFEEKPGETLRLTRVTYAQLLQRAIEQGWVTRRGVGNEPAWVADPAGIWQRAADLWRLILPGERLPYPVPAWVRSGSTPVASQPGTPASQPAGQGEDYVESEPESWEGEGENEGN